LFTTNKNHRIKSASHYFKFYFTIDLWIFQKNLIFFHKSGRTILRDYYMTFSISALVSACDSHIKPDSEAGVLIPGQITNTDF
jgi:hypothetical protein